MGEPNADQSNATPASRCELTVIRSDDRLTHVALRGALDLRGTQAVEAAITVQVASRRRPTVVDLHDLSFLSSLGISLLVSASRGVRLKKLPFVLARPNPEVDAVLRSARLNQLMTIVPTLEEALAIANDAPLPDGDETAS